MNRQVKIPGHVMLRGSFTGRRAAAFRVACGSVTLLSLSGFIYQNCFVSKACIPNGLP